MGSFLACFGFTRKRKRRKNSSKIISEDQSCVRYVPLDSDVAVRLDINEMPNVSDTKPSDKPKESSSNVKIKKKVSFNLNVRSYEPIPNDEVDNYFSEGEEKTMWEFNPEERAGTNMGMLEFEEDSIASRIGSYPGNYRYQNCTNSYDEEDEIKLEESDLDDDEDDLDCDEEDDGESDDNDNQRPNTAAAEVKGKVTTAQLVEESKCGHFQLEVSPNQEVNSVESNQNARNRSPYVHSVLIPVENLTQWKAVKANSRQQLKHQKENIIAEHEQHMPSLLKTSSKPLTSKTLPNLNHSKPMTREITVDASLSNWLF